MFKEEVENIGDLLMLHREFLKGTVGGFLKLGRVGDTKSG